MLFRVTYICGNINRRQRKKTNSQWQWLPLREGREMESGKRIEVLRV